MSSLPIPAWKLPVRADGEAEEVKACGAFDTAGEFHPPMPQANSQEEEFVEFVEEREVIR